MKGKGGTYVLLKVSLELVMWYGYSMSFYCIYRKGKDRRRDH